MDSYHPGTARPVPKLPNSLEEYHFSGILFQGQLENRGAIPLTLHGEWRKSAIIFLWTEAGTPGKQVKPEFAGRKRRLYGLNNVIDSCKNRGYLRCFMGRL